VRLVQLHGGPDRWAGVTVQIADEAGGHPLERTAGYDPDWYLLGRWQPTGERVPVELHRETRVGVKVAETTAEVYRFAGVRRVPRVPRSYRAQEQMTLV
jgi:hypothetical protein